MGDVRDQTPREHWVSTAYGFTVARNTHCSNSPYSVSTEAQKQLSCVLPFNFVLLGSLFTVFQQLEEAFNEKAPAASSNFCADALGASSVSSLHTQRHFYLPMNNCSAPIKRSSFKQHKKNSTDEPGNALLAETTA